MQHIRLDVFKLFVLLLTISLTLGINTNDLKGQHILLPNNPLSGRQVFIEKGCVQCHAIQGEGGNVGPDLAEHQNYGSYYELAGVIWNHAPQMFNRAEEMGLKIPTFEQNEFTELITYIYYLHYLGHPGDKMKGMKILEAKRCFNCHRIGRKGEVVGPDLNTLHRNVSPLYIVQAMWNHSPQMSYQTKNKSKQFFQFNNNELIDLAAAIKSLTLSSNAKPMYLAPGNPKSGESLFNAKGCNKCHTGASKGETPSPDFEDISVESSAYDIASLMWNHGPDMWTFMKEKRIAYPRFNGQELADIIAYIYFIHFNDHSGKPERGKQVFAKNCSGCHAMKNQEHGIGPDVTELGDSITSTGIVQVMWNHAPAMREKMAVESMPWPEFQGNDMADLYAYLKSLTNQVN